MPMPDPVAEGRAYRESLLALLGDDDPADVQGRTPDLLRSLVKDAGNDLRVRPAPTEWSVLELVAHITDAELVCAARYRWTLAHDEPELIGYDQDLWVDRLRANEADPHEMIDLLEVLRRSNIALWRRTPEEHRSRAARHAERGLESYGDLFRMMAGHDRFHLDQITQTVATLRG